MTFRFTNIAGFMKIPALAVIFSLLIPMGTGASVQDDINAKQKLIDEYQRQIDQYEAQAVEVGQKSKTLQNEIARLNAQIGQISTQIKQLAVSIDQTGMEIQQTTGAINDAEEKIALHQGALAEYIRALDETDRKSLAQIILQNNALSDFFDYVHQIQLTQDNLRITIGEMRDLQIALDGQRNILEGKKGELERMKGLTEIQQRDLASAKGSKNGF